jgi:hypothetical protein
MLPILPKIYQRKSNFKIETHASQSGFSDDTSSTYDYPEGGTFVYKHSDGKLRPVATDGVAVFGYTGSGWLGASEIPEGPYNVRGNVKDVINPTNMRFAVTVTDGSATVGASGPKLSAVTIGTSYECIRPTSGDYLDYQMLDSSASTNAFFKVVEKPEIYNGVKQDANTTNPVVIVELVPTIQS